MHSLNVVSFPSSIAEVLNDHHWLMGHDSSFYTIKCSYNIISNLLIKNNSLELYIKDDIIISSNLILKSALNNKRNVNKQKFKEYTFTEKNYVIMR